MSNAAKDLPFWHLDDGFSLFVGPLRHNKLHAHATAVFLAGVYGPFRLRIDRAGWRICRTAVVPAGVAYEFDLAGQPLAVLYLEPDLACHHALMRLVGDHAIENGAVLGKTGEIALMREVYEDHTSGDWAGRALTDLISFSRRAARKDIDPRMAKVVKELSASPQDTLPVQEYAGSVGLSASRFQHVFTAEVGVPFRRYRSWHRLRTAIRSIVAGNSFTNAAHEAGFCDQAHFAHDFRRTFGASASPTLKNVRR
jgi:AraC-like DNA-binding protein